MGLLSNCYQKYAGSLTHEATLMNMTANTPADRDLPPEEARGHWIWRTKHQVDILHSELASYYRAGSTDHRTIRLLWQKIEEYERILRAEGVEVA